MIALIPPCRRRAGSRHYFGLAGPGVAVAVLSALLSGCDGEGVLDPQGPISAAERLILLDSTAIMLVVVLPVIVLTLGFAWWYRAANTRAVYRPDWSYSGQVELVVWSIPAMIVLLLASVGWTGSHQLDPARKLRAAAAPLRVQVVSLDWKWLFIYPQQQIASVNELFIPAGVPVEFELTSGTVMNSFFIPQLGSQIYTMAGMTTHLNLLADTQGDFPGFSAQFSGDGFSDMRFITHALSADAFQDWQARVRAGAPVLDASAYAILARATGAIGAHAYRTDDPKLFAGILQHTVQPAEVH